MLCSTCYLTATLYLYHENQNLKYMKIIPSGKDPNTPTYLLDSCPILRFFRNFASSVICPLWISFLTKVPLRWSLDSVRLCGQRSNFRFPALDGGVLHDLIDLRGLINALSLLNSFAYKVHCCVFQKLFELGSAVSSSTVSSSSVFHLHSAVS